MYGFSVFLSAQTASFRDPGAQLYHATLPMPPVSTIIGIAGSALGFAFDAAWKYFKDNRISVGVIKRTQSEKEPGQGLDLWKYRKLKSGNNIESDIVKREFLFQVAYQLCYGAEEKSVINELYQAFNNPHWALTLGNSDDLAKIDKVSIVTELEAAAPTIELKECLVIGDHTQDFLFVWEDIKNKPLNVKLNLPMTKSLPVDFTFSSNGVRTASKFSYFTFLTELHKLRNPGESYYFEQNVAQLICI